MKNYSLFKIVFIATVLISLVWCASTTAQQTSQETAEPKSVVDAGKPVDNGSQVRQDVTVRSQESDRQTSASLSTNNTLVAVSLGVAVLSLLFMVALLVLLLKTSKKAIESQQPILDKSDEILGSLNGFKEELPKTSDFPTVEAFSSNVQEMLKKYIPKNSNDDLARDVTKELKTALTTELNKITQLVPILEEAKKSLDDVASKGNDALFAVTDANEDLKKEKTELLAEKQQLRSKIDAAKAEEAQNTRTIVQKEMDSTVNQLNTEIKSLQQENLASRQKLSALEAKAANADAEGYKRGLDEGMAHLEELSQKNGALAQQLNESQTLFQAQMETAKAQAAAIVEKKWEKQIAELQAMISEKDTHIQGYRTKLDTAETELQQHRQKTAELEKRAVEEKAKQEQLTSETTSLKKELDAVIAERDKAVKECSSKTEENKRLQEDNKEQLKRVASLDASVKTLQTAVFPEAFLADSEFTPLKEHLDAWREAKIASSEIVSASLFLFAQRKLLDMDSWERALKNLSLGITLSMRHEKASEEQILAELVIWSRYLMKFADETHDFSLKIPDVGDNYDDGWMTSQNRRLTTVKRILTWAVYHNQYGIHQLAEVE